MTTANYIQLYFVKCLVNSFLAIGNMAQQKTVVLSNLGTTSLLNLNDREEGKRANINMQELRYRLMIWSNNES